MKKINPDFKLIRTEELDLGECIGMGGFGSIFKAMYKKEAVAVKMLKEEMADHVDEFLAEFKLLSDLCGKRPECFSKAIGLSFDLGFYGVMTFYKNASLRHAI
mmetsp:Transcript_12349/g.6139  ORF Transcript_12349/g.6139 Transcript_12349/m.6139 type:complete len:103 (+) Transcript_12349:657-965(+)